MVALKNGVICWQSQHLSSDALNPPGQASLINNYKCGITELAQDETFQFSILQLCRGQCFLHTAPPLVRTKPSCSWTALGLNSLGLSSAGCVSLPSLLALIFSPQAGKSPPTPLPQEGLGAGSALGSCSSRGDSCLVRAGRATLTLPTVQQAADTREHINRLQVLGRGS